jgi:hypothetical protein
MLRSRGDVERSREQFMSEPRSESGAADAPLFQHRREYEQALMRVGRRLQALGQLLEQGPTRLIGKGFDFDPQVTGPRPVQIDMDELRNTFDRLAPQNVGRLLAEYQAQVAAGRAPVPGEAVQGEPPERPDRD